MNRPRYAAVAATFALVVAISTGGAYAATLIGTSQLQTGAVTYPKIATNAVGTAKIINGAVTNPKIGNGSVTSGKLANGAVGMGKLDPSVRTQIVPPWGVIPSGRTVIGSFYRTDRSGAVAVGLTENVDLPAAAPTGIAHVAFGTTLGGTSADPACAGTPLDPSAAPGYVCIYLGQVLGLKTPGAGPWEGGMSKRAFYVTITESAANTANAYYGTWAYTAP